MKAAHLLVKRAVVGLVGGATLVASAGAAGARVTPQLQQRTTSPSSVSSWYFDSTETPSGRDANLAGVACASTSTCITVGSSFTSGNDTRRLLERWDAYDGYWYIESTPAPAGSHTNAFNDAACPGASTCFVVGRSDNHTLAERWNGSYWSVLGTPSPTAHSSLLSIACPSTTSCFAVGTSDNGRLLEHFNGSAWTIVTTPGAANAAFNDIACSSTVNCTIVGRGGNSALIEQFNGSHWSVATAPLPKGRTSFLNSVACPTTNSCLAGGGSTDPSTGETRRLMFRKTGSAWAVEYTPLPSDAYTSYGENDFVTAVSCAGTSSCAFVGSYSSYYDSPYVTSTLIESFNSSYGWSVNSYDDAGSTVLNNVKCVSNTCIAVGSEYGSATVERGY